MTNQPNYCRTCHDPFLETYISPNENFIGVCQNADCEDLAKHQIIFKKYENWYTAELYQNPYQPNNVMILNKSWKTKESDLFPWVFSGFCKINAPSNAAPKPGEYFIVSFSLISKLKLVEDDQLRFLKLHRRRLKKKVCK